MSEHIPGPWMAVSHDDRITIINNAPIPHNQHVCTIQPAYEMSYETKLATARLICEAPTMLELLQNPMLIEVLRGTFPDIAEDIDRVITKIEGTSNE